MRHRARACASTGRRLRRRARPGRPCSRPWPRAPGRRGGRRRGSRRPATSASASAMPSSTTTRLKPVIVPRLERARQIAWLDALPLRPEACHRHHGHDATRPLQRGPMLGMAPRPDPARRTDPPLGTDAGSGARRAGRSGDASGPTSANASRTRGRPAAAVSRVDPSVGPEAPTAGMAGSDGGGGWVRSGSACASSTARTNPPIPNRKMATRAMTRIFDPSSARRGIGLVGCSSGLGASPIGGHGNIRTMADGDGTWRTRPDSNRRSPA